MAVSSDGAAACTRGVNCKNNRATRVVKCLFIGKLGGELGNLRTWGLGGLKTGGSGNVTEALFNQAMLHVLHSKNP